MYLSLLVFCAWFPPSFYLGWVHHELPCCSPLLLFRKNWRRRSGLIFQYVAAARSTWQSIPSVLCTLLYIAWGHATIIFVFWLDDYSDVPHFFPCNFQRGLTRGCYAMLFLLFFPAMSATVDIWPNWSFRNSFTFVDFSVTSIISNSSQLALYLFIWKSKPCI